MDLHFFDPNEQVSLLERRLPHWSQVGVVTFLTWRTIDSIPSDVLRRWRTDREDWLRQHSINPRASDWRTQLQRLERPVQREFFNHFSGRWHDSLDRGLGACPLRQPHISQIVATSLEHFDGDRYELFGYVVMPNHVHLLAAFPDDESMLKQCTSWKHYTAVQIHRVCGLEGKFWQQDGFDHLVRSVEQYEHLRRYLEMNPVKANLRPGAYRLKLAVSPSRSAS